MSDVNGQIRATIDNFVNELNGLVRQAALEAVAGALGSSAGLQPRVGRARGPAAPARARPAIAARGRGAKRTPEELAQLTERLYSHIAQNPGQGIETIGKQLAIETKELTLPIKKLIGEGRVSTEGQKRATKYFAGGAAPSKGGRKGRGRKRG